MMNSKSIWFVAIALTACGPEITGGSGDGSDLSVVSINLNEQLLKSVYGPTCEKVQLDQATVSRVGGGCAGVLALLNWGKVQISGPEGATAIDDEFTLTQGSIEKSLLKGFNYDVRLELGESNDRIYLSNVGRDKNNLTAAELEKTNPTVSVVLAPTAAGKALGFPESVITSTSDAAAPSCPSSTTLANRIQVTKIPLSTTVYANRSTTNIQGNAFNHQRRMVLSEAPNGDIVIAWTGSDQGVRFTRVNAAGQVIGQELTLNNSALLWDMVAHDDGHAALVLQNRSGYLVRMRTDGSSVFSTRLSTKSSGKWGFHDGSLGWDGTRYGAYFGVSNGGHEGDSLVYVDASGSIARGGWGWGCSHSMDLRINMSGSQPVPVCLSDAYPSVGLVYNNRARIEPEYGRSNGTIYARLGGLALLGERAHVAYYSRTNRQGFDVKLASFDANSGRNPSSIWLTNTPSINEASVKLARYGSNQLLTGWITEQDPNLEIRSIDGTGQTILSPAKTSLKIGAIDDFRTLRNGDVAFAGKSDVTSELNLVRVRACE